MTSAALAEVCALLSAILVFRVIRQLVSLYTEVVQPFLLQLSKPVDRLIANECILHSLADLGIEAGGGHTRLLPLPFPNAFLTIFNS